ncbi:MAG: hypothetical protein M1822_009317 [Bathelium mastoideum]|nr:MAG: hypothetical protein M1822_009317 [Bathelium mastoideum]
MGWLYDPPYALHGAAAAATPVASDPWPTTIPASPASAPLATTPKPSASLIPPSLLSSILAPGINSLTRDPKSGNGNPAPSGDPSVGADPSPSQAANPGGGHSSGSDPPSSENPSGGDPSNGDPSSGDPSSGDPSSGDPSSGDPSNGDPFGGNPPNNDPSGGNPSSDDPSGGDPSGGDPSGGDPSGKNPSDGSGSSGQSIPGGNLLLSPSRGQSAAFGGTASVVPFASQPPASEKSSSPGGHVTMGIGAAILSGLGIGPQSQGPAANGDDPSTSQEPGESGAVGTVITKSDNGLFNSGFATETSGQAVATFTDPSGHTHTALRDPGDGGTAVVDGSVTMAVGGSAVTVNGRVVSLASNGLVVGKDNSAKVNFATVQVIGTSKDIFTDPSGQVHTVLEGPGDDRTAVVDGSVTMAVGGSAFTINGEVVSLASNGLIAGGSGPVGSAFTTVKTAGTLKEAVAIFTDPSGHVHTVLQDPGDGRTAVVDGSVTLTAGGSAVTISGEMVSLTSNGLIMDGTSSVGFSVATATGKETVEEVMATFTDPSGHVHTVLEEPGHGQTAVMDGSITLTAGGPATVISGETVSLASNDLIVDGTSSIGFSATTATGKETAEEVFATFTDPSGRVHTVLEGSGNSRTAVLDGSITLTVGGPAVTVDGDIVSLASSQLVVNKTSPVGFAVTTAKQSGSTMTGVSGSETTASSVVATQGAITSQAKRGLELSLSARILGLGITIMLSMLPYVI